MFINKKGDYGTISIYPHLNEAPTQQTFMSTRIEIFDSKQLPEIASRPIRFQDNWYTPDELLELAAACQEAARIARLEGERADDKDKR